jgi:RNA ligase (TIGR02306 family)
MPIALLNEVYAEPEMVLGISSVDGGKTIRLGPYEDALILEEGVEVTDLFGVTKYEPPIPSCLAGVSRGNFPSFLRKTDEDRIQNSKKLLLTNADKEFYITEKLEGSSTTYYLNNDVFGVCSRNMDLEEVGENSMWNFARENGIEEKMRAYGRNIAIQGEIIGPGIQGNIYKLGNTTVKFFSVFDIDEYKYVGYDELCNVLAILGVSIVPIVGVNVKLPTTVDEILAMADGKSLLNKNTNREGLVFRTMDGQVSFKAISNNYLLKNEI